MTVEEIDEKIALIWETARKGHDVQPSDPATYGIARRLVEWLEAEKQKILDREQVNTRL